MARHFLTVGCIGVTCLPNDLASRVPVVGEPEIIGFTLHKR